MSKCPEMAKMASFLASILKDQSQIGGYLPIGKTAFASLYTAFRSDLEAFVLRLFTHKAIRSDLNICKNLPPEMGKYDRIP